jgi:hypothetical protein
MRARLDDELAVRTEFAFALPQRVFVERGHGKIPVDRRRARQPELFEVRTQVLIEIGKGKNGG